MTLLLAGMAVPASPEAGPLGVMAVQVLSVELPRAMYPVGIPKPFPGISVSTDVHQVVRRRIGAMDPCTLP